MLNAVIGQATKLFDKRFLLSFWFPTLLFGGGWVALVVGTVGTAEALETWNALPELTQGWVSLAGLLAVTLVAYLCDNLVYGLVRWYEGYWPERLSWLIRRRTRAQQRRLNWLSDRMDRAIEKGQTGRYNRLYARLYFAYPRDETRLMPTRLGNVLRAAEEYSLLAYNADSPTLWPRLVQLLPAEFKAQLEGASIPLVSMLFCATLSGLFAVAGSAWAWRNDGRWTVVAAVLAGGLILARMCYGSAVQRAAEYGTLIRTAFDLHRHKVIEALGLEVPGQIEQERDLWAQLASWWYTLDVPLEGLAGQEPPPGQA